MSGGPVPILKKYTLGSKGIWETIRRVFALVPDRSSGNPLPNHFRAVPPGARIEEAKQYKDPITIPAGDIKGNDYFRRDYRRNYPQTHAFSQTKVLGLLKLGSSEKPRVSIGDKGTQELAVYGAGQTVSLSSTLANIDASVVRGELLGVQGEPIVAPSLNKFKWTILKEPQHGMYDELYPCRIFSEAKP